MKKEVVLAIIVGFSLGLIITLGIYTARRALRRQTPLTSPPETSASPSPTPSHGLTITSPTEEALLDQDKVILQGLTTPNSLVTVITPQDNLIVTANSAGEFQTQISLVGGVNQLQIVALTPDGQRAETSLTLTYSTVIIEP